MKPKRIFDFTFASIGLLLSSGILILIYVITSIDTCSNGLFFQTRIGQFGTKFTIIKFKTIHPISGKVTPLGRYLRTTKLDELPQLWNILLGHMSVVGPRPDIPGYYDTLEGETRQILMLKPGLTSEASIKYANEETILATKADPQNYNETVIFPDKVAMNLHYYYTNSFFLDVKIIWKTVVRKT